MRCQSHQHRSVTSVGAIWLLLLLIAFDASAASFDFVESPSNLVLARLHTDGTDPFDHTNVTELTFTEDGDARFGFGEGAYASSFDSTYAQNKWTSSDIDGLRAVDTAVSGIFFDDTPPASTLRADAQTPIFSIHIDPNLTGRMEFVDGTLPDFITAYGTWQEVPEPRAFTLLLFGAIALRIPRPVRKGHVSV